MHSGQSKGGVLREVGDELDTKVGEGRGGGPRGHEEERGRGGNGVVLAWWGVQTGSDCGKRGAEVVD